MWRLWNKLFGFEYVHVQNLDLSILQYVYRIQRTQNGKRYIDTGADTFIWIDEPHLNHKITYLTKEKDYE